MADVTIKKTDLEKLGRTLIKEVYDFFNNEYFITNFPEVREEQKKFEEELVKRRFYNLNMEIVQLPESVSFVCKKMEKDKYKDELNNAIEELKNETLDIHTIYDILNNINLDSEIEEDLYFKNKAFLDISRVYENGHTYLKD